MLYINNVKFAKENRVLSGKLDLASVPRINEIDDYRGVVDYTLSGFMDELNRPTINLKVCGIISALCQNCLQEMQISLDNLSRITVFYNEEDLDSALFSGESTDVEDGVLAENEFDVMMLVEDEVIMLLPLAPKHDACLGLSYHDDVASPFSELKKLV